MKITHLPFNGKFKVTWRYGAKADFAGTSDGKHHGIDLVGLDSKNVYSTVEGVVEYAGWDPSGFGNYVKVVEDVTGLAHYYAHLESINVNKGQRVSYTTKLGIMGATGNVTGPHLHYEIRRNGVHINPTTYMLIPNKEGLYNANNFLIDLNPPKYTTGRYKVNTPRGVNVRTGPGTNYRIKKLSELTKDARSKGGYVNGTIFDVFEVKDNWGRTPSGWVCLDYAVKI
jgi:hypothetical protein